MLAVAVIMIDSSKKHNRSLNFEFQSLLITEIAIRNAAIILHFFHFSLDNAWEQGNACSLLVRVIEINIMWSRQYLSVTQGGYSLKREILL